MCVCFYCEYSPYLTEVQCPSLKGMVRGHQRMNYQEKMILLPLLEVWITVIKVTVLSVRSKVVVLWPQSCQCGLNLTGFVCSCCLATKPRYTTILECCTVKLVVSLCNVFHTEINTRWHLLYVVYLWDLTSAWNIEKFIMMTTTCMGRLCSMCSRGLYGL